MRAVRKCSKCRREIEQCVTAHGERFFPKCFCRVKASYANCKFCKKEFIRKRLNQRYCNQKCFLGGVVK